MNILIVGGAGYIGSVTVQKALERGHNVYVVDNLSNSSFSNLEKIGFPKKHFLQTSAWTVDGVDFPNIDGVIYLAAKKSVTEGEKEAYAYIDNNINQLDEFLNNFHVPIVFASSAAVYGEPEKVIHGTEMRSEALSMWSPIQPTSVYGMTKVLGEKIITTKCKNARILRYFNVGGASDIIGEEYGKMGNFIPRLFQSKELVIRGGNLSTPDGYPLRDYIHVLDVARINLDCVEGKVEPGTYNIASGVGTSTLQLVEMVGRNDYTIEPLKQEESSSLIGRGNFELEYNINDIIESSRKWYEKNNT